MFLCSGPKKGSRALNRAFYYDNVNIKAEKNWNNRFNTAFFWKRLGFIFWGGGGGWGCLRKQVVTCLRRQPQIFFGRSFSGCLRALFWALFQACGWLERRKKPRLKNFRQFFLFSFGVNDRCFLVLAQKKEAGLSIEHFIMITSI